eukprot:GHVL01024039.1.p1 GENE.GHVL01024039.1~~GHVL01024039.1.p1  ORF type:complete len:177 (-),score=15.26 GHVL01024039.1:20-550(-)
MRNYIKKRLPQRQALLNNKLLGLFGNALLNPSLWYLNKHSVSRGFAVGLFFAWIPVPFQMGLSAFGAIVFNANLPLSVCLVWLTNPITMPALFSVAYFIGARILKFPTYSFKNSHFEFSCEYLRNLFINIKWQPFVLGCLVLGICFAIIGYITSNLIWNYLVRKSWKQRSSSCKKT